MKNKNLIGKLGLLLTAIIWGSGFTFSSMALQYFTTFQVIALRFTIAFFLLLLMNAGRLKQISKQDFIKGVTIGGILFSAYFFQTKGLEFTTTSKNSFLTAVNVVLVPFISWLVLRQNLSKNALLGALISLIGIGFTSFAGGAGELAFNFGDVLSLAGAVFFGAHIFYTDHYGDDMANWVVMLLQMGTAALLSWIAAFIFGETHMTFTAESLMPILYIGIISTLVGYGLQTAAQKFTTSGESAVILSTEAFFGMLTAVILLGEPVVFTMVLGGILIFCGILVVELKPLKEKLPR
ncbi:DMT family transporter [Vaginisenegalia massiliensis]|uniref:DMT family transporter n=1 Tax=Vaginisenegalia massiliensis TaxID=2058294 RepID=UPI000F525F0B|nr:DMT family transporter [Vaginisenegalia massiliensis]